MRAITDKVYFPLKKGNILNDKVADMEIMEYNFIMEISISIEPFLKGKKTLLRKYLDEIVRLAKTLPLSVHFDFFDYRPDILRLVGGYTDKIAVHLHSMLPDIKLAMPDIVKHNFASVSIHNDKPQHIVFVMNITNTICGIVFDLPVLNIDDYADEIKKCAYATVMTVTAGASGRPFDGTALDKIAKIRAINPNIKIIVDGGVNDQTVAAVRAAGSDIAVVGSYAGRCYAAGDFEGGIKKLL
jgi:ribulose-phosphate 3-epimerase